MALKIVYKTVQNLLWDRCPQDFCSGLYRLDKQQGRVFVGSVTSDVFDKSPQKLISKILEVSDEPINVASLVHDSIKDKVSSLELAIVVAFTSKQAEKLKIIKTYMDNFQDRKEELEQLILALAAPYQQELAIILTTPGIKTPFTAIGIISEIGVNMEAFPSAKHLCS